MLLNTMETVAENEEPGLKCLSMTFDEEHLPNTRCTEGCNKALGVTQCVNTLHVFMITVTPNHSGPTSGDALSLERDYTVYVCFHHFGGDSNQLPSSVTQGNMSR